MQARYEADVYFDTTGDVDYAPNGRANFVVIEDRTKGAGCFPWPPR